MTKREQLDSLKREMEQDVKLPLREGATQLVFGEGNPDAEIYFLGEAPGYYEDQQGRPFVGSAGKLLDRLIESIGKRRTDVYISNVVRFRPPANRDPEPEEIGAFAPYVDREMEIIDPKLIVTLGRFSMQKFLPGARISSVHGRGQSVNWNGKMILVLPMYHPAAALRNGAIMNLIRLDFSTIPEVLAGAYEADNFEESKKEEIDQLSLI